jgi:hypothetical protein
VRLKNLSAKIEKNRQKHDSLKEREAQRSNKKAKKKKGDELWQGNEAQRFKKQHGYSNGYGDGGSEADISSSPKARVAPKPPAKSPPPKVEEKNVRVRNCKGCAVEYMFFPNHHAFDSLPEEFVCNNCVDQVICFGCNEADISRDHEMILCDDCLLKGAHFNCLGLAEIPEGDWYCLNCVWKNEKDLIGDVWACPSCSSINHSRW